MERIIKYGGKLFFGSLIICILSFFYFKLIPYSQVSNLIGYVFLEVFLGYNFYIGYRYKLNIKESLIVGTLGCGFGIFLLFFATYTYYILQDVYWGIWMVEFYFLPTTSFINDFFNNMTLNYTVFLILFNILLVLLGSRIRFLKEKIVSVKQKNNLYAYKDFL
ncbi:MAG: hypothetical protein Q4E31_07790 [Intestinibacter bartlettii]|uniref:hypothetical protein n=1 Tax=Intestinibacter bartlettii TaxID=261299 RepID=UPI0026F07804|nr:hypothetical protein [Intestinibacter bartlettii]MDO5010711.1 hypothetical protein [Intestinibacter bartlettii]